VQFHRSVEDSKRLNNVKGPAIIISSSGMLTGGRVLHHLFRLLPQRRNLIALVGFQAAGTRGRALLEGARTIRIHGEDIPVRADVLAIDGLSAHADSDELMRWVQSGGHLPREVFLTHGEPPASAALGKRIAELGPTVHAPALGQSFTRDAPDGKWRSAPA
jgi:metallo-beta-lactamase family protein